MEQKVAGYQTGGAEDSRVQWQMWCILVWLYCPFSPKDTLVSLALHAGENKGV